MKRNFKAVAIALTLVLVLGLAACGGTSQPAPAATDSSAAPAGTTTSEAPAAPATEQLQVVLGNPQPLSGINAQLGRATSLAIELAVHEINEAGGFNGVPIKLVNYDDENSPEVAVRVGQRMLQQDGVNLVIGSLLSSNLMAVGDMFEDAKIVTMGNGNGTTFMSQGWDYMFRAGPNLGFAMPTVAQMMADEGYKKVSVFHGIDDATKSSAEAFMESAKGLGLEITATETYMDGDTDFAGQVTKMLAGNPDAILIASNAPTFPLIVKQLRLMDWDGPIYNREAVPGDALAVAGDAVNGVIFVYPYITYETPEEADDPFMVDFLKRFQAYHGEMPFHDVAYRAYDGMMALWEASKIAGANDSESLRQAMHQVKFKGIGGDLDWTDGSGEGKPLFRAWIMKDGKPVPQK